MSEHLKEEFHKASVKQGNYNLPTQENSFENYNLNDYLILFDDLFKNYVPRDLQYVAKHITLLPDRLICNICDCALNYHTDTFSMTYILVEHFSREDHIKNIKSENKTDEKYFEIKISYNIPEIHKDSSFNNEFVNYDKLLDDIFSDHIPEGYYVNRPYIIVQTEKFTCSLCNWDFFKPKDVVTTTEEIVDHFKGYVHSSNLKSIHECESQRKNSVNDIGLLDLIFENYVNKDLQNNKNYISLKSNRPFCCICECVLKRFSDPELAGKILSEHFIGEFHKKNLKQSDSSETQNVYYDKGSSKVRSVDKECNKIKCTIESKLEENSTCVNKNDSLQDTLLLLDDILKNYMPKDLQFNAQYITPRSNELLCNICNCTFLNPSDPVFTNSVLIEHFKGETHIKNLKLKNNAGKILHNSVVNAVTCENNKEESSKMLKSQQTQNFPIERNVQVKNDNREAKFLDIIFDKFIDDSLKTNKQYITFNENVIKCNICNCVLSKPVSHELAAKVLLEHITGGSHRNKLKQLHSSNNTPTFNEFSKILDEVFQKYVPKHLRFHMKYISLTSAELICMLCDESVRLHKSQRNNRQFMGGVLKKHLTGRQHKCNVESSYKYNFVDESFLDTVFKDFIPYEYHSHRPYLTVLLDAHAIHCSICDGMCRLPASVSLRVVADLLMEHLSGYLHIRNVKVFCDNWQSLQTTLQNISVYRW